MRCRIYGSHRSTLEQHEIHGKGRAEEKDHQIKKGFIEGPCGPSSSKFKLRYSIADNLDADLRSRINSYEQRKPNQDYLVHCCPHPTSATPTVIRLTALSRGNVMRSPNSTRPPTITPTIVMLPAITP